MKRRSALYFGTNTKLSMTDMETIDFLSELRDETLHIPKEKVMLFVIPSYTVLERAGRILDGSGIVLGAQNMCWDERGQYTGEVSPLSLREIGVSVIEIGHSERRHIFHEEDKEERKKVCAASEHGFMPLLCIGETEEDRTYNISDERLAIQLKIGAGALTEDQARSLIVAYEPVWAIGVNGVPAEPEYVEQRHKNIRRILTEMFGKEAGADIPILYGGSVNMKNAEDYIKCHDVDGLFVGRSAWSAKGFAAMVSHIQPIFERS